MSITSSVASLSPRDDDAVLFDLDGVLTRTARVHAAAWKRLFDHLLQDQAAETGKPFVPFDMEIYYRQYVDGEPREDGVAAFLEARRMDVPRGGPDDGPAVRRIHGLGPQKDEYFLHELHAQGIERYDKAIELVRALRAADLKTAVVSSSKNCAAVLEAAGIADLFDAQVDGLDLTECGLEGKPAPDAFRRRSECHTPGCEHPHSHRRPSDRHPDRSSGRPCPVRAAPACRRAYLRVAAFDTARQDFRGGRRLGHDLDR